MEIRWRYLGVFLFCFILISPVIAQEFEVSSFVLKVVLNKGDFVIKPISIYGEVGGALSLEVDVSGVTMEENSLILHTGETKNVNVVFDSNNLDPGVYVGRIKINSGKKVSYIPIVFEVESEDVFFDINLEIPPVYSDVSPGEKMVVQLDIFDLTSGGVTEGVETTSVNLDYNIYRVDGTLINTESENIVVGKKTQLSKSFFIPKNLIEGNYVLGVTATYLNSVGTSSSLFYVIKRNNSFNFKMENNVWIIVLVLVVLGFFLGVGILFLHFVRDRDKLIFALRKDNSKAIKDEKKSLKHKIKKIPNKNKRKMLRKNSYNKIKIMKRTDSKRVKQLMDLKKKGNVKVMKQKIAEWEKKGYNTAHLKNEIKNLSKKKMQSFIDKWKKFKK